MRKKIWVLLWTAPLWAGCVSTRFQHISSRVPPGTQYGKILVHSNVQDFGGRRLVEGAFVQALLSAGVSATASTDLFPQGVTYTLDEKEGKIQAAGFDSVLSVQIVDAFINKPQDTPTPLPTPTPVPAGDNPVETAPTPTPPPADDYYDSWWMGVEIVKETGPKGTKAISFPISGPRTDPGGPEYRSYAQSNAILVGGGVPADQIQMAAPTPQALSEKGPSFPIARFKIRQELLESKDFKTVWRARAVSREDLDLEYDFSFDHFIHTYAQTVVDELKKEGIVAKAKP